MLKIEINNTVIPYYPNISLPVVENSPFFTDSAGKIPGDYIFNTNFPASDALKQVFSFAHKITRSGRATAELPYVITQGVIRYFGTCIVQEANEFEYEIAFKFNKGQFASAIKDKTLKDLDLGTDKQLATVFSATMKQGQYLLEWNDEEQIELETAQFPLSFDELIDLNNNFDNDVFTAPVAATYHFKLFLNYYTMFEAGRIRVSKNGTFIQTYNLDCNTTSILDVELDIVLAQGDEVEIIVQIDYWYTYTFGVDDGSYEYTLDNIFDEIIGKDQDETDFTIFPFINEKFFENFPDDAFMLDNLSIKAIYSEYFKVLNYFKDGKFPLILKGMYEGEAFIAANLFTPTLFMAHLLEKIITEAGYTIENNPFESDAFKNMVLMNQYTENFYSNGIANIIPVKNTFNLTDHVPEINQSDFIRYASILTGYFPLINSRTKTVKFINITDRHIVSDSIENWQTFDGIILWQKDITVKNEYNGIQFIIERSGQDSYLENIKEISEKLNYKGNVLTVDELPESNNIQGDMYLITGLKEFYVWQYNPETYTMGWVFFTKDWPLEYTEGSETFYQLTTKLCPALTRYMKDTTPGATTNKWWIIPCVEIPGILEGFPDSLNGEYGLQVLYLGGLKKDSNNDDYPIASAYHLNIAADDEHQDLNAKSIYDNIYKDFVEFIVNTAKPTKLKAVLTPLQLSKIDITKIQTTPYFNFLIKQKRHAILADNISIVDMDVYVL